MTHVAIIVQARMTSTRLPGKVLKEVAGMPLLQILLERLERSRRKDSLMVATTTLPSDDPVAALCDKMGVPSFRGSEEDVLSRFYHAALQSKADAVVRITADCPLIDPDVVDRVIDYYLINQKNGIEYVSNSQIQTYPRGLDVEIFSFRSLSEAQRETHAAYDREHVTPFIRDRPERYPQACVSYPTDDSKHRWTVDTPEDFELVKLLIEASLKIRVQFTLEDCLLVIRQHPEWTKINAHIEQKKR